MQMALESEAKPRSLREPTTKTVKALPDACNNSQVPLLNQFPLRNPLPSRPLRVVAMDRICRNNNNDDDDEDDEERIPKNTY
jgi:hypothetical protein